MSILRGPVCPELLRDEILADIFEATARRVPDLPALEAEGVVLTYRELDERASLMAHHLLQRGARGGTIVGLWMPRGMDLLVAQLAIAKTGAAWLPCDADIPAERVEVCLQDAGAVGIVTSATLAEALQAPGCPVWLAHKLAQPVEGLLLRRDGARPEHPAYVIYTSGSTGKPKGVPINQGAISHFLRSENAVLGIREGDRVYQGFSVAFDMSFEEIWISYLVGATLWIAPREITADPDALPRALMARQISVLHAVPTLLALFAQDVPTLRIINLGGEMCPQSLVERWARPGRQVFNTYGPTEATVSASLAELHAGEPVTIGQPLPNYGLLVVDAQMNLLPAGETGELCIIGPGVAEGYLGRPELTAEKFLPNPWASHPREPRLYRTGDLAKIDEHGQIHCLGRADDQVKVRGFRVELGEIEAVLSKQLGTGTAAVVLKPVDGIDQLVAYYVSGEGAPPSVASLRAALREQLPPYMVPVHFEHVEQIPRLTSGKIDRKTLAARPLGPREQESGGDVPDDAIEEALFAALTKFFPGQAICRAQDFFDDLGGHSLLAARLVSALRSDARFAQMTVHDIYQHRRVGAIADVMRASQAEQLAEQTPFVHAPPWRRYLCGAAQLVTLPFMICLHIMNWLSPFFTYHYFTGDPGDSIPFAIFASVVVFLVAHLLSLGISVLASRILLSGIEAGDYPLWGLTYFRWWLADRLHHVAPAYLLSGSSLYNSYLRAMGAKIGRDVVIGSITIRQPHLLDIGDGVSIGSTTHLENVRVERGWLKVGAIKLGREAYVGSYAVMQGNTSVAEYGHLESLSSLSDGQSVGAWEVWDGAPARKTRTLAQSDLQVRPPVHKLRLLGEYLYFMAGAALTSVLFFLPIFPAFVLVDALEGTVLAPSLEGGHYFLAAIEYAVLALPASAVLIVSTALIAAAIRWLVLPRLRAGSWPVHSGVYCRKWIANQIQVASLHVLHGVYATVYAPFWYRLLGAKIGKGAEISTAMGVVPDMLTLGDDTFIADAVMLGDEQVDSGWMSLDYTVVGNRSFVGNGAYVPDGTTLPHDVLIGVQSKAPASEALKPGATWVGSPPLLLPSRETVGGFPESVTFRPSPWRRLGRGLVEAARILLPLSLIIGAGYVIVLSVMPIAANGRWWNLLIHLALCGLYYGVGCFLFVAALKWLLIGAYKPRAAPMWTPFVWISEALTNLYESIAVPNFLEFLRGTPMLPLALRLMGVKTGKAVYMDTTDVTEFDCVSIGDYAELNAWSGPQTHLFEDRIMKIGRVLIGKEVCVGTRATVLYDAEVGDGAVLGPLTLVMKGERIPPATAWTGSPAQARKS